MASPFREFGEVIVPEFDVDVVVSFEAEKVSIYECGESLIEMLKGFRV